MSKSDRPINTEGSPLAIAPIHIRCYDATSSFERKHMPLSSKVVIRRELPIGWERYIHPEGKPYYFHPGNRILTESIIESKQILAAVMHWHDRICTQAKQSGTELTNGTEVVIELNSSTTTGSCRYYLVERSERKVFWYEAVDTEMLDLDMAISEKHLHLAIEEQFWTHVEYFPNHSSLPKGTDDGLIAVLKHAAVGKYFLFPTIHHSSAALDQMTSELSTSPWTAIECETFLKLLSDLKESGEKTCIVARLWRTLLHSRFINMYGCHGARLSRSQSILSESQPRPSRVLTVLSRILLFNAAEVHSSALAELWVDKVVYAEHWCTFMKGLKYDWAVVGVLGTLILAVNVNLLNTTEPESICNTASTVSTVFSITGVLSAFLLARQHREAESYNASRAGQYLESTFHPCSGHQRLAIIFCLPYAFSIWSLIALTVALLASCFTHLSPSPSCSILFFSPLLAVVFVLCWSMAGFWKDKIATSTSSALQIA